MKRAFIFLVKLSLVLTSLLVIAGGRTSLCTGTRIVNITNQQDAENPESGDHYNFNVSDDIEKWIEPDYQEIILTPVICWSALYSNNQKIKGFTYPVWEPPKSC
jgi:hypothetical protein